MVGFLIVTECESRVGAPSGRRHTLRSNLSDWNYFLLCISGDEDNLIWSYICRRYYLQIKYLLYSNPSFDNPNLND